MSSPVSSNDVLHFQQKCNAVIRTHIFQTKVFGQCGKYLTFRWMYKWREMHNPTENLKDFLSWVSCDRFNQVSTKCYSCLFVMLLLFWCCCWFDVIAVVVMYVMLWLQSNQKAKTKWDAQSCSNVWVEHQSRVSPQFWSFAKKNIAMLFKVMDFCKTKLFSTSDSKYWRWHNGSSDWLLSGRSKFDSLLKYCSYTIDVCQFRERLLTFLFTTWV